MSESKIYKKFVSQFTLPEWKKLCRHRLFLHFLKFDLKIAASMAADALERPVVYKFPLVEKSPKAKSSKSELMPPKKFTARHRRRFDF